MFSQWSARSGTASFLSVFHLKGGDIKLSLTTVVVHEADLAKDGSLRPTLVVNTTDRPHATCRGNTHKYILYTRYSRLKTKDQKNNQDLTTISPILQLENH